jgi:hypothetical protein
VLIVDGTLVPTRDTRSKNYWYSTNHQVVIDVDTRLIVVVGCPLPAAATTAKHGKNPEARPPSATP